MDDGPTSQHEPVMESVDCPLGGKAKVPVMYSPGYMSWHISSISAKKTRVRFYHSAKYRPQVRCSACGGSQADIRAALERGHSKQVSHEDRLARLKAIGFSGKIENRVSTP
jgi:hypothetical protein